VDRRDDAERRGTPAKRAREGALGAARSCRLAELRLKRLQPGGRRWPCGCCEAACWRQQVFNRRNHRAAVGMQKGMPLQAAAQRRVLAARVRLRC